VTDWSLPGSGGEAILGNTHVPSGASRGTVLLCHGFKGYKDYGFFPRLAQRCAEAGFVTHRFNFSHSGMTNRVETFERPDLFERDTWGRQIDDLLAVARAVQDGSLQRGEGGSIWFGHSRGGITVLNTAARIARGEADAALMPTRIITAAAPSSPCRIPEQHRERLRQDGYMLSPSGRTGQALRVGADWLHEIEREGDRLNPCVSTATLDVPVLLIHGAEDPTVPVDEAHELHDASAGDAELTIIPGAQHTFNCPNPLAVDAEQPPETRAMIDAATAFAQQTEG